jgi:hypothetical protein
MIGHSWRLLKHGRFLMPRAFVPPKGLYQGVSRLRGEPARLHNNRAGRHGINGPSGLLFSLNINFRLDNSCLASSARTPPGSIPLKN